MRIECQSRPEPVGWAKSAAARTSAPLTGRFARLSDRPDRVTTSDDAPLNAVVDEIRLRVAVEIAKLAPNNISACEPPA